eukprot:m.1271287 g.1271287  ORF g.1271287 m.1271287 type:complete len:203 (-) comp24750_c0_seq24:3698-4306(-)
MRNMRNKVKLAAILLLIPVASLVDAVVGAPVNSLMKLKPPVTGMGILKPLSGGVQFSRKVNTVAPGTTGSIKISNGNCQTVDTWGSNNCDFTYGSTLGISFNLSFSFSVDAMSTVWIEATTETVAVCYHWFGVLRSTFTLFVAKYSTTSHFCSPEPQSQTQSLQSWPQIPQSEYLHAGWLCLIGAPRIWYECANLGCAGASR